MVRSYTEIGGEKHYDSKSKIILTDGGYYFDKDGTIYQNNFNDIDALPTEWKLSGNTNGTASVTSKGELEFIRTINDKSFLYLDRYVGNEYIFQCDMTITDVAAGIGAYVAPTFGYQSTSTLGYAYIKYDIQSDYQGKIQGCVGTTWNTPTGKGAIEFKTADNWASRQEYCIILGDFNPENCINGTEVTDEDSINPGSKNMYQIDWKKFTDAGFEPANGGRFGAFGTLATKGVPRGGYPWDSVFVSSNIKIVNAQPVYEPWMNDHAIFVPDLEIN